jgi:hypothetical protein
MSEAVGLLGHPEIVDEDEEGEDEDGNPRSKNKNPPPMPQLPAGINGAS